LRVGAGLAALVRRLHRGPVEVWQTLFCDSGFDRCVRYRLTAVGGVVPADLLPDGRTHLPQRARKRPTPGRRP
jgi:hypothetical protein